MSMEPAAEPGESVHLIVVEDEDVEIEHHVENWLAFIVFWGMAAIVFLQFFTRYVLNDSLAWTEEIARYALMWLTFIGAAVVARKNLHISGEAVLHYLPKVPARVLLAIVERMQWQRMVIIDLPMSIVYGGVALGCFIMLIRQLIIFYRNARDGWRKAQESIGEGLVMD